MKKFLTKIQAIGTYNIPPTRISDIAPTIKSTKKLDIKATPTGKLITEAEAIVPTVIREEVLALCKHKLAY